MEKVKSHGKKIFVGLASIAAAAGLYYFYSNNAKKYPTYTKKERIEATKQFRVEKEGDLLLGETVLKFQVFVFEQAIPDYLNRIVKHRKDRRKHLDNPEQYTKSYIDFRDDMFKIKTRIEKEILEILNISQTTWEMSLLKEQDNTGLIEFYMNYPALIKSQLESDVAIEREALLEILNDLVETIVEEDKKTIGIFVNTLNDPTLAQTLLEMWAYDVVYTEFGYEEEDVVNSMNQYYMIDPEMERLNKKFYKSIRKAIKDAFVKS